MYILAHYGTELLYSYVNILSVYIGSMWGRVVLKHTWCFGI